MPSRNLKNLDVLIDTVRSDMRTGTGNRMQGGSGSVVGSAVNANPIVVDGVVRRPWKFGDPIDFPAGDGFFLREDGLE